MGMKVKTDYTINSSTMMMSAKSMFPSPDSMKPMELTVDLSALGPADVYAFGAFKPAALPQAYIYFTIDKDFKNPVSTFMIINQGKQYNCVISSSNKMMSKEMRGKMMMKNSSGESGAPLAGSAAIKIRSGRIVFLVELLFRLEQINNAFDKADNRRDPRPAEQQVEQPHHFIPK